MGFSHGTRWTDEAIKERIMEVVESLQLDRMPSRSECQNYYHNSSLTNAVSKRFGWYNLAQELGLEIKESETWFGKNCEIAASELLKSNGFEVRRMPQNFPYDLLVDDCIKIDVKASKLYKGNQGNFYSFNLEKSFATCDFYLLLAVNDDGSVARRMVVPSNRVIANNQISVGEKKSKYYCYTDRFDLIEAASSFWSGISKEV